MPLLFLPVAREVASFRSWPARVKVESCTFKLNSGEILKPFLEGKDIKPWHAKWRGLWLIYTHHGVDMTPYPTVLEYLRSFKTKLEKRATAHLHPWYELQQPQFAYKQIFESPKIMYPEIANAPKFYFDEQGYYYPNKTIFVIPSSDRFLQSILISSVMWYYLGGICTSLRGGNWRFLLQSVYMETLPIAQPSAGDRQKIACLAEALSSENCANRLALEAELNDRVAALYGLTPEERKIVAQGNTN